MEEAFPGERKFMEKFHDATREAKNRRDLFALVVFHAAMNKGGYMAERDLDRYESTAEECAKFADALIAKLDEET